MLFLRRYWSVFSALRLRKNSNLCKSLCYNVIKRNYQIGLCTSHSHHGHGHGQCGPLSFRFFTKENKKVELCWHCQKGTKLRNNMICAECGHLIDVNTEINYFDVLNCSQSFELEPKNLTRNFREMQTIVHPDKYSNKSEREQRNSAEWSSLINKAYKTLATPIERGEYLLQLQGLQILDDKSIMDNQFLMKMMERNEAIEDAATEQELHEINKNIAKEMNEKSAELIMQFNENDLNGAMRTLVLMKYLRRLQKTIKSRLQSKHFL